MVSTTKYKTTFQILMDFGLKLNDKICYSLSQICVITLISKFKSNGGIKFESQKMKIFHLILLAEWLNLAFSSKELPNAVTRRRKCKYMS